MLPVHGRYNRFFSTHILVLQRHISLLEISVFYFGKGYGLRSTMQPDFLLLNDLSSINISQHQKQILLAGLTAAKKFKLCVGVLHILTISHWINVYIDAAGMELLVAIGCMVLNRVLFYCREVLNVKSKNLGNF